MVTNCKYCSADLPAKEPGGHRPREYCSDKHRQAYFRQQHQNDQAAALLAEVQQLRQRVQELEQTNTEFEKENSHLRSLLLVEQWFHTDQTPRTFPAWLKKQPSTPFTQRFLKENLLAPLGNRSRYEGYLRRGKYSEEEKTEFEHLWKLMYLQS